VLPDYQRALEQQRKLVKKADWVRQQLLLLTATIHALAADPGFVMTLRTENLADLPAPLAVGTTES
jgi:hypothetical protein